MRNYEDIIEDIGGFGRWQLVIFISITFPDIFYAMALLLPIFIGAEPSWSCSRNLNLYSSDRNYNETLDGNYSIFVSENSNHSAMLKGDICCSANYSVHHFRDDFTSVVSEWDLVCGYNYVSDLITTIQMFGLLFGAAISAQISDNWGRKKTQFIIVGLLVLAGSISAFAINWQMFAITRFFVGLSAGGYFCLNCVYPIEFVSRRWRILCGTIGYWAIGQVLLAPMAYFLRNWHHLVFATSLGGLTYLPFWMWLPESPRWLAQNGHTDSAKKIFCNIAKRNGFPKPDLTCLDKIKGDNSLEKDKKKEKRYTYLDLFKNRTIAKISFVTMALWFISFLGYYELSFNVKRLSGNRYLNVVYGGLLDMVAFVTVMLFTNRMGRRWFYVTGVSVTLVVTITTTILIIVYGKEKDNVVSILALITKSLCMCGTYVLQIYSAELFPTEIRNIGVGIGSIFGRIGTLLGPQLLYLGTFYTAIPYIVISCLSVVAIPLCFLLPETTGKPLVDDYNFFISEKSSSQSTSEDNERASEGNRL